MIDVTFILLAAAVGFGLSQWRNLPAVPLLILCGVGLGASPLVPSPEAMRELLMLGLAFLVFSAGTELNPRRIGGQLRSAIFVGIAQFLTLGGLGMVSSLLLGFPFVVAAYLALGLAASSTLVVVRILQQREQFFEPFGRLVLGVLLVQDVLVILLISILSHSEFGLGTVIAAAKTLGLLALSAVFLRWVTPYLLSQLALDDESLLLSLLAILFLFAGLSQTLNLPLAVGAFLAGIALSGFPINGLIRGQLLTLSNFFLAVFFVSLGALLKLPAVSELQLSLLLSFLVVLVTAPLVTLLAERSSLSTRSGIEAGLLLSQTSEFSIVLALIGLQQGHLDDGILSIMTLVTVMTMMLTPFLATDKITWRLMRLHPSRWQQRSVIPVSNHFLLLGAGESGRLLLQQLLHEGRPILVVDDDPIVVDQLRKSGVNAIRGDGADFTILRAAGAQNARVIISTMRRLKDHLAILKVVKTGNVICRVFEAHEADQVRLRGGIPVLYSQAAAAQFLNWFTQVFRASEELPSSERP